MSEKHEILVARYLKETGRELTANSAWDYIAWLERQVTDYDVSILTERERDVFDLAVKGYMTKEIAEKMNIGVGTINAIRGRIMDKTDSQTLIEAIYKLRV